MDHVKITGKKEDTACNVISILQDDLDRAISERDDLRLENEKLKKFLIKNKEDIEEILINFEQ